MLVAFKIVCRLIGISNLVLCAYGAYMMYGGAAYLLSRHLPYPYFRSVVFATMAVGIFLLGVLVVTAIELIRMSPTAVASHCALVAFCFFYLFLSGFLWLAPVINDSMGAGNVGGLAIAPFLMVGLPYAYPLISAVVLFILQERVNKLKTRTLRHLAIGTS